MSLSDDIRSRILRHEIALRGYTNAEVRKVLGLLTLAETDLEAQIRKRLGWIAERGYDASDYALKRLESNLKEVRLVLKESYRALGKELRGSLYDLADAEAGFAHATLATAFESVGVSVGVGIAEGELLRAIVSTRPFQGALLKDWVAKLERDAFQRVSGAIRQGLLQGEGIDKIVARLRGTRASRYTDGALAISRREAETIARTAVMHVSNSARDETWAANQDLIKGIVWVATLDGRTCEICIPRDGKLYTVDHKPIDHAIPWGAGPGRMHMGDRCTSSVQLKSWRELGISAKEVTGRQRAALTGFVPSETTFGDWIKTQPASVQNQALGKRRAELLRSGEAKFAEMFDRKGHLVSLQQLREAA